MLKSAKISFLVLVALSLLQLSVQKIKVISPPDLKDAHKDIVYSLARFGDVDYFQSSLYQVAYADPADGCSFVDHVKQSSKKVALIMHRGNCTFSRKAANGVNVSSLQARPAPTWSSW